MHYLIFFPINRAIPIIGENAISDAIETSLPRNPGISLSLLNLLENSEGSRRSTEVLSDAPHSRQTSLDATIHPRDLPLVPGPNSPLNLDQLYAKVIILLIFY